MISRVFLRSSAIFYRSGQQSFSNTLLAVRQWRRISILLPTTSVQSSFISRRYLSKSTKSNKKYQVGHSEIPIERIHCIFQPISYGPKSKRPIIEIYHKMTVKALARAMDINVG